MNHEINSVLLSRLHKLINKQPSLRFGQLLSMGGFVTTERPANINTTILPWVNEFHLASEDLLLRVDRRISGMEGHE